MHLFVSNTILTADSDPNIQRNLFYYYYSITPFIINLNVFPTKRAVDVRVKNQLEVISQGNGLLKHLQNAKFLAIFASQLWLYWKVLKSMTEFVIQSMKFMQNLKAFPERELRQPSHRGISRFSKQVVNPCLKS